MSDVSTKLNTFSFIFYANCSKTRVNCGEPVWKLISLLSSKCESSHTGSQSSLFYYYVILRQILNIIAMYVCYILYSHMCSILFTRFPQKTCKLEWNCLFYLFSYAWLLWQFHEKIDEWGMQYWFANALKQFFPRAWNRNS